MVQVFAAVVIERRKVFQALLASEARRARTERFSLVMVTEVGLDGRWLKVPPTLCRLLGYAEEELLGLRFQDVTHADDLESTWRQCLRVIRGELKSFDRESRYVRKDGGIVWGYLNCSVVTDEAGVPLHFVAYIRDISKAKQAEDALRQSEIRFRGVFESGIVPMAFWNTRGEVIEANETYLRLIGRTRSELEAGTLHCHDLTPAEQAHLDQRGVEEVFGSGSCVPFEKEYLRSDGTRVPVLLSASRMSEDTGLAIVIDLTERRRAEQEVEERLRFERLVSELVAAFATAPEDRVEALVPHWLGHLGRFLEADRVTLQVFATQRMRLRPSYSWAAGGADPRPLILQDAEFPYASARLQRGEPVLIELLDALPAEAATDREHFDRQGIAAVLAIPLVLSGQLFGALILAYGAPRSWPDDAIPRLRWVGEIFANVVARKTAEGEMRQAEVLNAAVLASLPGATAILDRHGTVVKVSGGWHARPAGTVRSLPPAGARHRLRGAVPAALRQGRQRDGDASGSGIGPEREPGPLLRLLPEIRGRRAPVVRGLGRAAGQARGWRGHQGARRHGMEASRARGHAQPERPRAHGASRDDGRAHRLHRARAQSAADGDSGKRLRRAPDARGGRRRTSGS